MHSLRCALMVCALSALIPVYAHSAGHAPIGISGDWIHFDFRKVWTIDEEQGAVLTPDGRSVRFEVLDSSPTSLEVRLPLAGDDINPVSAHKKGEDILLVKSESAKEYAVLLRFGVIFPQPVEALRGRWFLNTPLFDGVLDIDEGLIVSSSKKEGASRDFYTSTLKLVRTSPQETVFQDPGDKALYYCLQRLNTDYLAFITGTSLVCAENTAQYQVMLGERLADIVETDGEHEAYTPAEKP